MGNCLSSQDPWIRLRRKQLVFNKVMRPSSSTTRNKSTFHITNVRNVPAITNAVSVPSTGNVVNVPVTSNVVTVTGNSDLVNVTDDVISIVVSRIVAGAPKKDVNLQINSFKNVSMFTYNELSVATSQFRPELILGEGGFGLVYKGVIDGNVRRGFPSTEVAVKELNPDGHQGDREWLTEVNYLGQFRHPNLVKLIGYCCEDEHRLLVYEYMACGSLETHLFRRHNTLSWSTRMSIALDAAKGLAFLHGAERPIIYRDFKTSNILLDAKFNAKLSDFGLAKEGPMGDQTHVSTRVMGTYGYAAPEYIMTGHLTARSDVYGFGVVLLELIVGKRALDKRRPGHEHNLVNWARPLLIRTTKLLKILDPKMQGQYSSQTASKVGNLAHRCLSENPKIRPTMSEVVRDLEIYNREEILIEKSKAAKRLLEISRAALDSHFAAEISKQDKNTEGGQIKETIVHGGKRTIEAQNRSSRSPQPIDSDGPRKHSRSVQYGHHSLNCNVLHKHSRSVRNGCSPTKKMDGLQTDSRSAPNVAICI